MRHGEKLAASVAQPISVLLHYGWLLLAQDGQPLLDEAREFLLPGELDLRRLILIVLRPEICERFDA
jgi:hypothetical protein